MKFLSLVLLVFSLPGFAIDWADWEPLYVHHQLEFGEETYSIFVVQPHDVRKLLTSEAPANREITRHKLIRNRLETNVLLNNAHRFIKTVYFDRGVFNQTTSIGLTEGLKDLVHGKYPIILITAYNDPFEIYQTVSVGLDFGKGIPSEQRCVGRGMQPLARAKIRTEKIPIAYLPSFGVLNFDEEVSRALSEIPRVVGTIAELKTFSKSRYSKYDFGPLIHRILIAHRLHFWSATEVPVELRLAPLPPQQHQRVVALKQKFPQIPDDLLFPELQERVINDHLYLRAGRRALSRIYQEYFGFEPAVQTFPDPDFLGVTSYIHPITRANLEYPTSELLKKRPDFHLVREGQVQQNDFEALSCSRLLHMDDFNMPSARPGAYVGGIRLLDVHDLVVPRGSLLNKHTLLLTP